jgi:hypothetical protein
VESPAAQALLDMVPHVMALQDNNFDYFTPSVLQSLSAMAQSCVYETGEAKYAAMAIYETITGQSLTMYDTDCQVSPPLPRPTQNTSKGIVTIYPNPTNDILHVKGTGLINMRLQTLTGQNIVSQVTAEALEDHTINISSLDSGVYLLILEHADGTTESHKIIKL